ncbi:MAG: hypothetical protein NC210_04245 [[Clostridium] fimetarium]|nr:hypothetical protein [Alistipes timonensis]MCM1405614.1 hypothetical protein [[Clostridium] fimetarium]
MQPSAITSDGAEGDSQTFEYDDYGKVAEWDLLYNTDGSHVTASYTYPDDNTILVTSEDTSPDTQTYWTETIQLVNGRASNSEGTFIQTQNNVLMIKKTYRLAFEYDPGNHLTAVKHSEVVGIGDDLPADAWNKSWDWENYLIWENGNLKEYQDYQGNARVTTTIKCDYSDYDATYPVNLPITIQSHHHTPLMMQGVFGSNSKKLVKSVSAFDRNNKPISERRYVYELNSDKYVESYSEIIPHYNDRYTSTLYEVTWTPK